MQSDDALVDLIAGWIDEAALSATSFQATRSFNERIPISEHEGNLLPEQVEIATRRAAAWAFAYQVQIVENDGKWRVRLTPYFNDSGGHSIPPPVEDVPDIGIEVWCKLHQKVTSNFGKARLHHLLFERRVGSVRDHALLAARCHLNLYDDWERGLDKQESLNIALRLAHAVGAEELASEVVEKMLEMAHRTMTGDAEAPGVTLRLLRPLAYERRLPESLTDAVNAAIETYNSPFIRDQLFYLKLHICKNSDERQAIQSQHVQVWLNAADEAAGLVKAGHLKTALQRAHDFAIPELIERTACALQKMRGEDLGLAKFSASSVVSQEQYEDFLRPVSGCADWKEALINFTFAYGPAVGSVENTRERAEEFARNSLFASLTSTELLGSDGLPRFSPRNESDIEEMRMARQESFMLQHTAPLLAMALHKIPEVHGLPTEEDLTSFLARGALTEQDLAASIARCFIRYWTGDPEAATFTIAPKIETLARNLVLALDAGVYKIQRNEKPGQYPGLGSLLGVLRIKGLDESWYRNILTICGNPAGGWNLRNEIAHGFVHVAGSPGAAILLQCVLYLWTLGAKSGDAEEAQHGA
ncbi:DUF4209 domain-containing protein [Streptomyces sp. NPDC006274]|uniref:DUF4209 domain-containing protein n=1 Tax=unclassified Streptomyces TaxID=2593676 RepID=UPI0033B6109F